MLAEVNITLSHLDIGFKTRPADLVLVRNIQTGVRQGEMVGIIGRNGSGKTTLIRTLCRLIPGLAGELVFNGRNIRQYTNHELSKIIGYVSTTQVVLANLNIFELVSLGRIPHTNWLGSLSGPDMNKIKKAIDLTGLDNLKDRKINEISDGERQRAMIARTLAQDTEFILLDEPTAFLDMIHRYEIIHLLHSLTRPPHNKTVVFSTHDINIALQYADKFWILKDGGMVEGAPEDLVISDEIQCLVADSDVSFNADTGQFAVSRTGMHDISLCGRECLELQWTARALERLGFNVRYDCNELPRIFVIKDNIKVNWKLEKNNQSNDFYNIYDLTLHLRSLTF